MHEPSSGAGVSVVSTIRNEAATIRPFLRTLLSQSLTPDEIVLVDGGSSDGTAAIISEIAAHETTIRLIIADGVNIPTGRNIAIREARNEIIACTDAGCRLDAHWLGNIIAPLRARRDIAVVGGVYLPEGTLFQRCVGALLAPDVSRLNPSTFLPSSRSVAFKKSAWRAVGGYPEWLDMAEDTYFDLALRKQGFTFSLARDAVVYWNGRDRLGPLFRQMINYAYWNVRAGLSLRTERKKIFLYGAAAVLLGASVPFSAARVLLISGIALYLARYTLRAYRHLHDGRVFLLVPIITLVKEAGSLIGYLKGGIDRYIRRSVR